MQTFNSLTCEIKDYLDTVPKYETLGITKKHIRTVITTYKLEVLGELLQSPLIPGIITQKGAMLWSKHKPIKDKNISKAITDALIKLKFIKRKLTGTKVFSDDFNEVIDFLLAQDGFDMDSLMKLLKAGNEINNILNPTEDDKNKQK